MLNILAPPFRRLAPRYTFLIGRISTAYSSLYLSSHCNLDNRQRAPEGFESLCCLLPSASLDLFSRAHWRDLTPLVGRPGTIGMGGDLNQQGQRPELLFAHGSPRIIVSVVLGEVIRSLPYRILLVVIGCGAGAIEWTHAMMDLAHASIL
jgi:hypothetical protein